MLSLRTAAKARHILASPQENFHFRAAAVRTPISPFDGGFRRFTSGFAAACDVRSQAAVSAITDRVDKRMLSHCPAWA